MTLDYTELQTETMLGNDNIMDYSAWIKFVIVKMYCHWKHKYEIKDESLFCLELGNALKDFIKRNFNWVLFNIQREIRDTIIEKTVQL